MLRSRSQFFPVRSMGLGIGKGIALAATPSSLSYAGAQPKLQE